LRHWSEVLPERTSMYPVLAFRLLDLALTMIPARASYPGARMIALLLSVLPTRRREALWRNMAVAHGPGAPIATIRRDVRRALYHALLNYIDLFRLARPDAEERLKQFYVPDWTPLDKALALGKGAILVSAHLGNFDTVAQLLALRGHQVYIPVEPISPPQLLDMVRSRRGTFGIEVDPIGADSFHRMAARLKTGGVVIIVSDRDIQGTGVPVSFFGQPVRLPTAAVLLGLRTGAPVLAAFGHRYCDGSISGRLSPPLAFTRNRGDASGRNEGGTVHDRVRHSLQELAGVLEQAIRMDPGQWVVQQPIFSHESGVASITPVRRAAPLAARMPGVGVRERAT
jgi:KDO2-lipid IV(A) lauroyltransferase